MPLAIPIILLLAYLVAVGVAASAIASAKAHTGWLPGWVKQAFLFALPVAQVFLSLGKWLTHHLGTYATAIEAKTVRWFGELVHYQQVVGYWSLYWPIGLYHFGEHLLRHSIPNAINARTKPLAKRIDATEAQAKATAGYAHSLPKVSKGQDEAHARAKPQHLPMPWASDWDWIHDHFDTLKKVVLGAAAGTIPIRLPHAPAIPHPWRDINKRIGKLRKDLLYWTTATGAAVLVARAIGGVTANCVKKGNIGRLMRHLCGWPKWLMDLLLLGTVEAFSVNDLCEFSYLMGQATKAIRPGLMELVSVEDALVDCHGTSKPILFDLPPVSLPAVVGTSPLAA